MGIWFSTVNMVFWWRLVVKFLTLYLQGFEPQTHARCFFCWSVGLGSYNLDFGLHSEHLLWSQTLIRTRSWCVVRIHPKHVSVSYLGRNSEGILRFAAKYCQCNHEITSIEKYKRKPRFTSKTLVQNGSDGKPNQKLSVGGRRTTNRFCGSRRVAQYVPQLSPERDLGAAPVQLIPR